MKIVIVGCGRVGARLARRFIEQGHRVSIVDKDRTAFRRLGDDFPGKTALGLGFDEDVLKKAGIQNADAFLAITGGDNSNLMAAQIAQVKYGIANVIARVKDPLRAEVYRDLGMRVYCNTLFGANILEDAVLARPFRSVEEYLELALAPTSDEESGASPTPERER